jgi:predicted small secreted protein
MKMLLLALALFASSCAPNTPSPVGEDLRSTEPGVPPTGYVQFCHDYPDSELCK